MKIWLDAEQPPPEGWDWVKSINEAQNVMRSGRVTDLSIGSELGEGRMAGLAAWVETQAFSGRLPSLNWRVHGEPSEEIAGARQLENAERYWSRRSAEASRH